MTIKSVYPLIHLKVEDKRNIELSCKMAFKYLNDNKELWDSKGEHPDDQYYYQQIISMAFYNMVFKFGSNSIANGLKINMIGSDKTIVLNSFN